MDEPTFDPRSWGKPAEPAKAADVPPTPVATPTAARGAGDPRLALGVSLVLLLGGAGAAWLTRQPARIVEQSATATPSGPTLLQRRIILSTPGDIAEALIANGVPHDQAGKVGGEAVRLLTGPGEVRAVFELSHSDTGTDLRRLQASLPDGSGVVINRDAAGAINGQHVAAQL